MHLSQVVIHATTLGDVTFGPLVPNKLHRFNAWVKSFLQSPACALYLGWIDIFLHFYLGNVAQWGVLLGQSFSK